MTGEKGGQNRTVLLTLIAIVAVAIAAWSITRTVQSGQGRNMGPLGGGSLSGGPAEGPTGKAAFSMEPGTPVKGAGPGKGNPAGAPPNAGE
ncbi:MAG: hypothetical protein IT208_11930 [Chthonomonadales bacterium]|nr:hypothetical protein [Chthonomonadales bacterium]